MKSNSKSPCDLNHCVAATKLVDCHRLQLYHVNKCLFISLDTAIAAQSTSYFCNRQFLTSLRLIFFIVVFCSNATIFNTSRSLRSHFISSFHSVHYLCSTRAQKLLLFWYLITVSEGYQGEHRSNLAHTSCMYSLENMSHRSHKSRITLL